jgi:two-component system response regulator GlrR
MRSILLVDDDEDILFFFRAMLEDEGYRVETCTTGHEALEKAGADSYDVMFVDYMLTDIKGDVLADELRRLNGSAVIFYLTGLRLSKEELIKTDAVSGVLVKPVTNDSLLAMVRRALDAPTTDNEPLKVEKS